MILNSKIYDDGHTGIPLLVVHGLFGMLDNWGSFGREFGAEMPCHLVDLRNHGKSFRSDEMSHQALADDILNYINHHKINQINLLGHSLGGKVAMEFAISYPERVNKLIVADIAPKAYSPHHQKTFNALQSIDFEKVVTRKDVELELEKYLTHKPTVLFLLKNLHWEEENKLNWRFNLDVLTKKYNDLVGAIKSGVFEKETLFLAGEKSDYILPQDEMLIADQFPNYQLVKIKNAGHWIQVENPKDFNQIVKKFLMKS